MEPPLSPSSILFLKILHPPFLFTILAFIIFITTFIYGEDFSCFFGQLGPNSCNPSEQEIPISEIGNNGKSLPFAIGVTKYGCDLFSGKWVRDNSTRPLYKESDCPYIKPQLTCQKNGRPDMDYLYWRWQPHGCIFPSFNATLMLEALRGKRMMFVGDSLIRGQFVSMVCLLHSIIPKGLSSMETFGLLHVFTAKPYNATIQFYWAPFLLESNSDDPAIHRVSESDRMVLKGSINKHGQNWKGADILVFNTYVWWVTDKKFKILQAGSFNDEKKEIVEVSSEDAYRMGLKSMLGWIEKNMDPKKTRVFFTGISPPHNKSKDWGGNPNGNCYNETTIIEDANYWGSDTSKSIMQIIGEEMISTTKSNDDVPVTFLNITQLSNYRKDAHTSIYKKQWRPLTPEQLANPEQSLEAGVAIAITLIS